MRWYDVRNGRMDNGCNYCTVRDVDIVDAVLNSEMGIPSW